MEPDAEESGLNPTPLDSWRQPVRNDTGWPLTPT